MQLDTTAFIRLDAPNSLGATASGAAFATNTGDILEIACFGPGIFRLRVGPNTRPDYGLVLGRAQRCDVAQPSPGVWTFTAGNTRLEIGGEPLSIRLFHDEQRVLAGGGVFPCSPQINLSGAPPPRRVGGPARTGAQWIAAFALGSGEPVY